METKLTGLSVISVGILGLALIMLTACATPKASEKGRSEVWGQTCGGCHYNYSPSSFNDSEWELLVHHMRQRAYLTAEEQRLITEFLKAAN